MPKKKAKYWYMTEIYACVLCGHEEKSRYRVYDVPKPDKKFDLVIWHDDVCPEHFM